MSRPRRSRAAGFAARRRALHVLLPLVPGALSPGNLAAEHPRLGAHAGRPAWVPMCASAPSRCHLARPLPSTLCRPPHPRHAVARALGALEPAGEAVEAAVLRPLTQLAHFQVGGRGEGACCASQLPPVDISPGHVL